MSSNIYNARFECLGTGWPSFYEALPGSVDETQDMSIVFMPRTGLTLNVLFPDLCIFNQWLINVNPEITPITM